MTGPGAPAAQPVEQPLDVMAVLSAQQDTLDRLVEFKTEATKEIHELRNAVAALTRRLDAATPRGPAGGQ